MNHYILILSSDDRRGIVAKVSEFLYKNHGFIIESAQFGDEFTNKFFLRAEFTCPLELDQLNKEFKDVAFELGLNFKFFDKSKKQKIILAVTKESHCMVHLLHKWEVGNLPVDIVGIVSNHETLKPMAERFGVEFFHLPIEGGKKQQQENEIEKIFTKKQADLLVLARYMQILSNNLCAKLNEKVINIHHSFLPGFKGAKPYHQAFHRGVKLIGATAHYVTKNLDEGPIIEQEVMRVDHSFKPEDLKQAGQDIENRVLYQAVKMHIEHRVVINGNKTVIL